MAITNILKMHWRTTYNGTECGVFVLSGNIRGSWHFLEEMKKEGLGQKVQLKLLRVKYLAKPILLGINKKKAKKNNERSKSIHEESTKVF